jgi:hypothetical protein
LYREAQAARSRAARYEERGNTVIVDLHTHLPSHKDEVPPDEERSATINRSGTPVRFTNSLADYLKVMEQVDRACIFGIAPRPWEREGEMLELPGWPEHMNYNDVAAEVSRASNGKIIPFFSIHPKDPKWNDEYDRSVSELGCKGMKLGLNYQQCDPLSEEAFKVFARAERDGIPIVFHMGTAPMRDAPLEYAHPLRMDHVAITFPELKMVLAHIAHPWQIDCIATIRKHPNVWADISAAFYRPWSFYNAMRLCSEWGVMNKIFFGTDWPIATPDENAEGIRDVHRFAREHNLPPVPEEEIEGIIHSDPLEALGLE